ncbi:MAG: hypothetical protein ACJ76J_05905 [Thermoanaerobaculia bacterium]
MRSAVFVTTTVLVLALTTVVRADDRDRYRHDDRYQDRYDDRYDNSYRGGDRNGRVSAIVREIEQTAAYMHREYERNNRRPDRDEARVAATLHELHEQAYELARNSGGYGGGYGRDSRHGNGYDGLLRAFDEVAYSLDRINRRPYVDRGMDRIWSLMSELDRYYGGSGRYGRGNDRGERRGGDWRQRGHDRDRYRN